MANILYIIGNGFDLYHEIPSSYWDFGQYLKAKDSQTYDFIDRFIGIDDTFWNELESRLANLDSDHLLEDMSDFLPSYGADDWSDSGHHDYQYEVGRVVEALSKTLLSHFSDWIRGLPIPAASSLNVAALPLTAQARYLSFNYTDTLQKTYGISNKNIVHIHGVAVDPNSNLILGHGYELPNKDPYRYESNPEDADTRVIEAISIVDDYFEETFKNTDVTISLHDVFFKGLIDISHIYVLGHSLEAVDGPYFEKILDCIDVTKVSWTITYYNDQADMMSKASELNIDQARTKFIKLSDLK